MNRLEEEESDSTPLAESFPEDHREYGRDGTGTDALHCADEGKTELEEELNYIDDELPIHLRAPKPAPPPPSETMSRQENLEPAPGAFRVGPGDSFERASTALSSDSSVETEGDDLPAAPPAPPHLASLVEAEPVVSSVLVEATPIDGELLVEPSAPDAGGLIPARWRHLALALVLVSVALTSVVVGLVASRSSPATSAPTDVATAPSPTGTLEPLPTPSPTLGGVMAAFLVGLPNSTQAEVNSNSSSPQARAFSWLSSSDRPSVTDTGRLTQRFALACVYYATRGEFWKDSTDWLSDTVSECEWYGCDCATLNETVRSLELVENNLRGEMPAEIGLLSGLENLNLSTNHLGGSLPPEIGSLTSMVSLSISLNPDLTGPMPVELANLEKLTMLWFQECALTGAIPSEIGALSGLQVLALWVLALRSSLPSELGQLTRLELLALNANELTGTIPSEIAKLTNLSRLFLNDNLLSGPIPTSWAALESLSYVNLGENTLTGMVPASWCDNISSGSMEVWVDSGEVTCDCGCSFWTGP